ncbi:substrate-binding domain-containing protein [Planctomonas sp. JC2975]|uniref:LacI family DNA-binding transcriptional regulator n=1 Tax=Planctomonas sp. JC2975 TaxID=2729626 RepID=UPI001474199D|nr:substrate-binding domain-containing protein [Planctomonas sp. JC2975]NNC12654.1 substrate-binding domain-containing protein [Planctomonas sp. JC2975]
MPDHDSSRPTLADVAAKAGVSASTASLAFSGSGPVAESTRERVLQAARDLHYAGPDPRARSLRRGRSGIIGVVIEERVREAFRDPIAIAQFDGLSEEIGHIDAALLILAAAGPAQPLAGVKAMPSQSTQAVTVEDAPIDAAVLMGCSPRLADSISALRNRGLPVVAIEGYPADGILVIEQDNKDATERGAKHLEQLGHERVAIVTLPLDLFHHRGFVTDELLAISSSATALQRLEGARAIFPDAPAYAAAGSYVDEGRRAAREILSVPPQDRPTAIIAQSDLLAVGVIRAAEELGISVPDELSVIGFDGVRVDGLWPYELTTLEQPAYEKGRAAGRAIVRMLAGGEAEPVAFTSVLHVGNTTAPPHP